MKESLLKYLGESCQIIAEGAGLAILIIPTKPNFDWKKLKRVSEESGIAIHLAKERSGGDFEAVRMGFGGFRVEEIEGAVEAFNEVWKKI